MIKNETIELPSNTDVPPGLGHAAVIGNKEVLRGPSKEQLGLLSASVGLASSITDQYPQTIENGRLGYAIAGSLAVMLLAQAESFEELDASQVPKIAISRQVKIPKSVSEYLKTAARHLSDLDYVQTSEYEDLKNGVVGIDNRSDPEAYKEGRAKYLWTGGTELDGLTDEARSLMKLPDGDLLSSDYVGNFVDSKAVRINVGGKEFYIVDPRTILAFKTVHLLESFDISSKPEKYTTDLAILVEGLGQIYDDKELLQTTHDTLFGYGQHSANGLEIPYHNPGFAAELCDFVERAVALDEDASYLERLDFGQERAVGILQILHQYETPEAKQKIVEFINKHREEIDQWVVNNDSERNIDLLAEFVDTHPEAKRTFVEGLADVYRDEFEAWGTTKWLRNSSMCLVGRGTILRMMESHEHLDHKPAKSGYLQILMHLDEAELASQLRTVEQIIGKGVGEQSDILDLLIAEVMQIEAIKYPVMSGLEYAVENFDNETITAFFKSVNEAAVRWTIKGEWIKVSERPTLIKAVLDDFGVPNRM